MSHSVDIHEGVALSLLTWIRSGQRPGTAQSWYEGCIHSLEGPASSLCSRHYIDSRGGGCITHRPFLSSTVSCDGLRHAEFSSATIARATEVYIRENERHEP